MKNNLKTRQYRWPGPRGLGHNDAHPSKGLSGAAAVRQRARRWSRPAAVTVTFPGPSATGQGAVLRTRASRVGNMAPSRVGNVAPSRSGNRHGPASLTPLRESESFLPLADEVSRTILVPCSPSHTRAATAQAAGSSES